MIASTPDPVERTSLIERLCGGDIALRSRVEALLKGQESATLVGAVEPASESHDGTGAMASIRGYTILEVLGEGGMGVVYLAEQHHPRRNVALKVIRAGLATPRMRRRFELESELLGRLQHPGIAQVYEAGTTGPDGAGAPFLAMELVRGTALNEFVASADLSTPARLELFVRICEAVHHAHSRGIIHRDLKPANILVASDGRPKILDFGIARAVESAADGMTLQTGVGELLGTLPYMSPEQILAPSSDGAGAIDITSDVYTLGVILYELLCGSLPHAVARKTLVEAARVISADEARPLSSVNPTVDSDLSTIAAKAMEKDRTRRYQSAQDLAADIERYLRDEPIQGRPQSRAYLIQKFVRRNRPLVVGALALVGALGMGAAGTAWQAVRATRGWAIAAEERDNAEATSRFLTDMLAWANPEQSLGREITVREVVDGAAGTVESRAQGKPRLELAIRTVLSNTYRSLGRFAESEQQATDARELSRATWGEDSEEAVEMTRAMALAQAEQAKFEAAEPELRWVIDHLERTRGPEDVQTALAQSEMARVYLETGRVAEAVSTWRAALPIAEKQLGSDHNEVLTIKHNLGTALKDKGDLEEGVKILTEVLEARTRIFGRERPQTLYTMNSLAAALQRLDRNDEAAALLRETLEIRRRVLGQDHPSTTTTLNNLAVALISMKRLAEAEPYTRQSVEAYARSLGADHPKTLIATANLAYLMEELGDDGQAEALYRTAVELRRKTGRGQDPDTWSAINNLAMLLQRTSRAAEAEPLYAEVLQLCLASLPADHYYTAIFQNNYGDCLVDLGKFEQAERELLDSHAVIEAKFGPAHARTAKSNGRLVRLYERSNKPDDAAKWRGKVSASGSPAR